MSRLDRMDRLDRMGRGGCIGHHSRRHVVERKVRHGHSHIGQVERHRGPTPGLGEHLVSQGGQCRVLAQSCVHLGCLERLRVFPFQRLAEEQKVLAIVPKRHRHFSKKEITHL
jgi:hypothetical protein